MVDVLLLFQFISLGLVEGQMLLLEILHLMSDLMSNRFNCGSTKASGRMKTGPRGGSFRQI